MWPGFVHFWNIHCCGVFIKDFAVHFFSFCINLDPSPLNHLSRLIMSMSSRSVYNKLIYLLYIEYKARSVCCCGFLSVDILCKLWRICVLIWKYLDPPSPSDTSYLQNLYLRIPLDINPWLVTVLFICLMYPLGNWITILRLRNVPS